MGKKNDCLPEGYFLLWSFVVILIVMYGFQIYFGVNHGRWRCVEYESVCINCVDQIVQEGFDEKYGLDWVVVTVPENDRTCICVESEKVCVREAWIREVKDDWRVGS